MKHTVACEDSKKIKGVPLTILYGSLLARDKLTVVMTGMSVSAASLRRG
ncbi:MAG: hypothetical protein ABSD38_36965 [Syntrophorhabdales bacterium]|jgi:hypothetical protein